MTKKFYQNMILCVFVLGATFCSFAQTAVERHGWLKTQGNYLLNEKGKIVQLKGMSFFWSRSNWYSGSSMSYFYSEATVDKLVDEWKCTVLRVAYATDGGNPEGWNECKTVIDAAIKKGVYVIIDWHAHDAHTHESLAKDFFVEQATKYKDTPNVIFELYNEPITAGGAADGSVTDAKKTWSAIKPYLTNVTKAIRNTGSKNLIILGTPYYCQHVGVAAADPVTDNDKPFENIAYAFHFYAASHGPNARYLSEEGGVGMENEYLNAGVNRVPVFVSEWGTSHSNGGLEGKNNLDEENTMWWFEKYVDKYYMSSCNWSVSDWQASSAFQGGINGESASGKIVRKILNNTKDTFDPPWEAGTDGPSKDETFTMAMPDSHPAAKYNKTYGSNVSTGGKFGDRDKVDVDGSSREWVIVSSGSGVNWIEYNFKLQEQSKYFFLRYLAKDASGTVEIHVDGVKKSEVSIEKGDAWKSAYEEIEIPSGEHKVRLYFTNINGTFNLNLVGFVLSTSSVLPKQNVSLLNSAKPVILNKSNTIHLAFPKSHSYTSYSLIRANGSIFKSEPLAKSKSEISINNLSSGVWVLKLNGSKGSEYSKVIVSGK